MIVFLLKSLLSNYRQGRLLYLLTVLGVALGVAAVLSVQMLNVSAIQAFQGSVRFLGGEADLSILGKAGEIPERLLVEVLSQPGVGRAWPAVLADVRVESPTPFYLHLHGLDLATAPPLSSGIRWGEAASQGSFGALTEPGWVAVPQALARERGWSEGDVLGVVHGALGVELRIGAIVDFAAAAAGASGRIAVMDIAQAQALFGRRGFVDRIDLAVNAESPDGSRVDPQVVRAGLESRLGEGFEVRAPRDQQDQARRLMSAFRLNLTALSWISLFVGWFIIYASSQASLVRRRKEFGVLRSLGATRGQLLSLILSEALVLGILGVLLGLPIGYLVADSNLRVVSATLSNFYLVRELESLEFPLWFLGLASLVGIGGSLAGTLLPALDIRGRGPVALLSIAGLREEATRGAIGRAALAIVLPALSGIWFLLWGQGWRPSGFVLGLSVLVAVPLLSPLLLRVGGRLVRASSFGWIYGVRTLGVQIRKTAVAVAALSVAASLLVGITFMIASFRATVEEWMQAAVQAEVYVSPSARRSQGAGAGIPDEVVRRLRRLHPIEAIDRLRERRVWVEGLPIMLSGVDVALPGKEHRFRLLQGDPSEVLAQVIAGDILISEPLSRRTGIGRGGELPLFLPAGRVLLRVAGIYYDYVSERGAAIVDWSTFERLFGEGASAGVALYLQKGVRAEEAVDQLSREFEDVPLSFSSNSTLRQAALAIFDQTFAVVRILQGMSLLIAAVGITLTLLILARERIPELALYRGLGATKGQLFRVFLGEGLGMALLGLLMGLGGGMALGAILVLVINPHYFGWTIRMHWPWKELAQQMAGILAAAAMASAYPALRASRTPVSELNRDEM